MCIRTWTLLGLSNICQVDKRQPESKAKIFRQNGDTFFCFISVFSSTSPPFQVQQVQISYLQCLQCPLVYFKIIACYSHYPDHKPPFCAFYLTTEMVLYVLDTLSTLTLFPCLPQPILQLPALIRFVSSSLLRNKTYVAATSSKLPFTFLIFLLKALFQN